MRRLIFPAWVRVCVLALSLTTLAAISTTAQNTNTGGGTTTRTDRADRDDDDTDFGWLGLLGLAGLAGLLGRRDKREGYRPNETGPRDR